jgi:hypothetical protein
MPGKLLKKLLNKLSKKTPKKGNKIPNVISDGKKVPITKVNELTKNWNAAKLEEEAFKIWDSSNKKRIRQFFKDNPTIKSSYHKKKYGGSVGPNGIL